MTPTNLRTLPQPMILVCFGTPGGSKEIGMPSTINKVWNKLRSHVDQVFTNDIGLLPVYFSLPCGDNLFFVVREILTTK